MNDLLEATEPNTIRELLTDQIAPLQIDDSVEHALGILLEHRVRHLPVVNDEGYLAGVVSEEQLLASVGPSAELGMLLTSQPISASPNHHVFEVTKVMVQHDLSTLPVAEDDGRYVGLVLRHDIFDQFAKMLSTGEPGAVVALEVGPRDYSLSQLVYTIEQNDVKILSIASEQPESKEDNIRVTLKLNAGDTTRIRHMLEHFGYRVVASFSESESATDLQQRAQEFMRYLEV